MTVSGTISATPFNTLKVIDQAFRRCRLPAQSITSEMLGYAKDSLYLLLSEMLNVKAPSWCVERQIYPLYQGQPIVSLDLGTVDLLNANLRTLQELTGATVSLPNSYSVDFTANDGGEGSVVSVGVKWSGTSVDLVFQVSSDGTTWVNVGTQQTAAAAGSWTWTDIEAPNAYAYFRITSVSAMLATEVYLGTMPSEIPMGTLNRDTYVAQSNKVMQGRPLTYWYQRSQLHPKLNLWPAPNLAAEHQQIIVWRSRHIMDVGALSQEIEVPQRWLEAIVWMLASRLALETPAVDMTLVPMLDVKAQQAYQTARDGDNSGSPIFIQPRIGVYTR